MNPKKLGDFLAKLRKEKKLTQTNCSELFNVTPQAISKWEVGDSVPDVNTLISIAKFYNITVDEILNAC